ncbi:MAG: putative hydrophobic protein (TIGR00271 family), partial [Patescibacteria group bacterium]
MPEQPTPESQSYSNKHPVQGSIATAWKDIKGFSFDLIDLQAGLDREGTIVNIKNNKKMAGANAWLLMCSIVIASLGLDLNSPAVIIGAMLISPLMSPILGIGLAVGINDRKTLIVSLKHFGIAIAIALVTSTLYFTFTPFGGATNEIIARTTPGLLDVAVAFFGGIAGIISGSRKDKSNAIPGVAIATALMPPLCVTGFGLANGNWTYTYNSFYLFFMNATFVALATFLIVRFLRFPQKAFTNSSEQRKTQFFILVFSILMIVPSILIFKGILKHANQESIITSYIDKKFPNAIYEFERVGNTDSLKVKLLLGTYLSPDSIAAIAKEIHSKGVEQCKLDFLQDSESRKAI